MKTEWHCVFLGRLINILSAKACRSAKQDELRSHCKTEQETALLQVSRACKRDSYWPRFSNQTLIRWIFLLRFFCLIVFLCPSLFFFLIQTVPDFIRFESICKQIKRTCFFRDLPQCGGGNRGLPWPGVLQCGSLLSAPSYITRLWLLRE